MRKSVLCFNTSGYSVLTFKPQKKSQQANLPISSSNQFSSIYLLRQSPTNHIPNRLNDLHQDN